MLFTKKLYINCLTTYQVDISICMPESEVSYGLKSHKLTYCGEWGQHSGTCEFINLRNIIDKIQQQGIEINYKDPS